MILIGENIHIISKSVQNAIIEKDETFIIRLIEEQSGMDFIDLNVGPGKGKMEGSLEWLSKLVEENSAAGISFDTTNSVEIKKAMESVKNPENSFINSTGKDEPRLGAMSDLALEYGCNLVTLTLSGETGIPKTADGRLEIAFEIYEKCLEKGIESEKLFFDPLVLPICVEQGQVQEVLNTIKMIKESFDPQIGRAHV